MVGSGVSVDLTTRLPRIGAFLGVPAEVRDADGTKASRSGESLPKKAWAKKVRGFLPFAELNLTEPIRFWPQYAKWLEEIKTMKTNPLFKFLGIATIGAAMAGTAVAGPSGGYTFTSLLGFGAGCPMRTPETKLVFVNTPKNTGLSQVVTGYRYKGCVGNSVKTMTLPWLQPLTCLQMIRS